MPAQPIKLDPAEARRRIAIMINELAADQAQYKANTGNNDITLHWDKVALEMALKAMRTAPELLAALKGLLEWGREHTSPRDINSPHTLLVQAASAVATAEAP